MQKSLSLWQLAGLTFTAVLGTLLHFLYDFTKIPAFTPFSAVNESTWEHMKILFIPTLIFAVIQSFFFKEYKNFWWIKLAGITVSVLLIPVLFYTYNGAFGKSPDWVNILIFFLSATVGYALEWKLFLASDEEIAPALPQFWGIIILLIIAFLFAIFTFFPPRLPLFQDPLTKTYGIVKK